MKSNRPSLSANSANLGVPILLWTAWHNSGSGYGLKVPQPDRAQYFDRSEKQVTLEIPFSGGARKVLVKVGKPSFWSPSCGELISSSIRDYLVEAGLIPWPKGQPPKVRVKCTGPGFFQIL